MSAAAEDEPGSAGNRALSGLWARGAFALGVGLALFHLAAALKPFVSEIERNALHFGGFALMAGLWMPAFRGAESGLGRWRDLAFGLAVAAAAYHLATGEDAIYERGVRLAPLDWLAAGVAVLGALEFSRRAAGPIIPALMIIALGYVAWWGALISGPFRFAGLSLETVTFRTIYGDDAMFGAIAAISSTQVFPFIIFGAFLVRSGAGGFVIALAQAVAGRLAGGPGLVAVLASALTGTISGSAVANTASTGVITIPLMKRAGFAPKFAAGVEAAASTGGQIMPPIMGAGAFVMASYTQIPYETIVAVAALPAVLYFASVAFFVRIEARRLGLGALTDEEVTLRAALRAGGAPFFVPIGVVMGMLLAGYTPSYAAVFGIGAVIASSWLGARPMGLRATLEALDLGSRNMIATAILLCAVGVVVNVIATAGVGNTFSLLIMQWAAGNLLIALVLIALASLVLGMGLPVTAAYIVLATLSAPALAGMIADLRIAEMLAAGTLPAAAAPVLMLADPGIAARIAAGAIPMAEARALMASLPLEVLGPLRDLAVAPDMRVAALLAAHMIIFWLSQDSNVTPPVCLAAFTAAAIAKSPPMATGLESWRLAKGLYIVPLLFAYGPILSGTPAEVAQAFLFALVGVYGVAAGLHGWMETRLHSALRVGALVAGAAAMWPAPLWVNLAGVGATIALFAMSLARARRAA